MSRQSEIREEAHRRGISQLFHFTPDVNVLSILQHGLGSRDLLDAHGVQYQQTKAWRLDDMDDAISVSIHSVNPKTFAEKRRHYSGEWVIFALDACILWTHECRFAWANAGSSEILDHSGFRGGPWAFREMFADREVSHGDQSSYRRHMERDPCEPTDGAAEVQVLEPIHPDLILAVIVKTDPFREMLEQKMCELECVKPVLAMPDAFG
ncbi:DarT ssDNA thymidine ADP-ribosyltransferase family protein [Actibacterium lipolyticum]|uniref:DarT domain-containing protein n=1 Tax=Actibacterium lipolyticum TaxID=1524263 RepID=A0A238JPW7_9RHOB|nr:DarT ssDNA thymidine ADP-ribosyltransferase family protein [Actibacterium lipolyticum]SMX31902.1 hypothetical protein COL8621_00644 [Actibacterium lipolyticum]